MHVKHTVILLAGTLGTPVMGSPAPVPDSAISPRASTLTNPVLWQDLPDLDVFRVGDVFYYSTSTFAYSPGAPVLKSYDLANWEIVTHSVPNLNFGAKYNLNGNGQAYVDGIWASSLRYRESNDQFYWMGCVEGKTQIWTSPGGGAGKNGGEVKNWNWTNHKPIDRCYYDNGIFIDKDDTMYVVYGNTRISVAQLSPDGLSEVKTQEVYVSNSDTIEGSRMYRIGDFYYIFVTRPAYAEWVLRSRSPFGPYEMRDFVTRISGPIANAGFAHQGGIVDTKNGDWYYVGFMDAYPGGRIPVVAPIKWTADGWPELVKDSNGAWGKTYPIPVQTDKTVASPLGQDDFKGESLGHAWEWNHNPDNSKWRLAQGGGLVLQTADVTTDLFAARNTLTHRIMGPKSAGTFRLDVGAMRDGDRAGAVLFRDRAAYIGVWKEGGASKLVMVNGLTLAQGSWDTTGKGTVAATGPTIGNDVKEVWLRVDADITPAFGLSQERTTKFSYSFDGVKFTDLGPAFAMTNTWQYFTGYRFGVFNHATKQLGGEVLVKSFKMELTG
ncbi:related to xylosidase/glycosyl hydrolase [Cephalotrichum gorgonifer]|uniref:Related to xylosidase/glycosyl hydrolase n=1 Tax=Cephalotrichum gorgonifer TaxID=2041049 RepID=A0AAE8N936_9PEZI|nr:related to xylosidase/glycosyl hydrolase [Cephalotrichum gorgonifer]